MNAVNKIVVITGGTGALGRVAVGRFLSLGDAVITTYLNKDEFLDMKNSPEFNIENFSGYEVNLSDRIEVEGFIHAIIESFGRIDVLVNIAGGFIWSGSVADMNIDDIDKMMQINFRSAVNISKSVLPAMIEKGKGKIINIGSKAGISGAAGMSAYAASKAALINFTQSLADEVKRNNIQVNVILPSTIDTTANRKAMPDADFDSWVKPASIADLIAFLASDAGDDITGAVIPIYGKL